MLLQAFYSIRSGRQLVERLEYDLLFRWFVGIEVDAAVWDHSVFSKNRDRLLEGNIAARFLAAVLDQPRVKKLLSTDHFTVDGTLIEYPAMTQKRSVLIAPSRSVPKTVRRRPPTTSRPINAPGSPCRISSRRFSQGVSGSYGGGRGHPRQS
jgi:Transposase domain (DUF772)